MYIIFQFLFLFLGLACFVWGILITGNDDFYKWWRDRYWKEQNKGELSLSSLIYNRYITGIGMLGIGGAIVFTAVSM